MRSWLPFRPWTWWLLLLLALVACTRASGSAPPPLPTVTEASPTETLLPSEAPTSVITATALAPVMVASPTATKPLLGDIVGWVWEDRCPASATAEPAADKMCQSTPEGALVGDGQRQADEPALAGVVVHLAKGACPGTPLSKTTTDAQGAYAFRNLPPGTYCVSIDAQEPTNVPLLNPGTWTLPRLAQGQQEVELPAGQKVQVDFARTIQSAELAQALTPTLAPKVAPSLTPTSTSTPVPTPTLTNEEKPYALGEPDMHDPMDLPTAHWLIFNTFPWAHMEAKDGKLVVTILSPEPTHNLWIRSTYPPLKDAYIEAVFITGDQCNHKDRYGLVVRSPSKYEGIVFTVSCDAMYKIYRWNGGFKLLRNWSHATMVHPGPNQVNRIGVWMEGNTLKLYINRAYVDEVEEDLFTEGDFALMVGGDASPRFQVAIDEVNYWTHLP